MMQHVALSYRFASEQGVLWSNGHIYYRHSTPVAALMEAQRVVGQVVATHCLEPELFNAKLHEVFQGQDHAQGLANIAEGIGEQVDLSDLAQALPKAADLAESGDDAPIVDLINKMLIQAIRNQVSDIHLEPQSTGLMVRFRQDGVLTVQAALPIELASMVVSRIKVMAKLDIAEIRLPQDGRFTRELAGRPVDVRVAMIPSGIGERVVMRLLDRESGKLQLQSLGMPEAVYDAISQLVKRPNGIILTTGPTNSGKTTTLYAALQQIKGDDLNIICLLYTSPSPRDKRQSRMPSSA